MLRPMATRRGLRHGRLCQAFAAVAITVVPHGARAAEPEIHASDVTQLAGFVRWPDEARFGLSFRVCLRDDDPAVGSFVARRGSIVDGKPMTVHVLAADDFGRRPCHLTFFSEGFASPSILQRLGDQPTLTVSSQRGFTRQGGLVEMAHDQGRLVLMIDRAAVANHPLQISAQLLAISRSAGE